LQNGQRCSSNTLIYDNQLWKIDQAATALQNNLKTRLGKALEFTIISRKEGNGSSVVQPRIIGAATTSNAFEPAVQSFNLTNGVAVLVPRQSFYVNM